MRKGMYLIDRDDLSIGLLDLSELRKEVPEARLRNNFVVCEYPHTVELWCRDRLRREVAPYHLVFLVTSET